MHEKQNKNTLAHRVWLTIPIDEIIPRLDIPGLKSEYISEMCKYNQRALSEAAIEIAHKHIQSTEVDVAAIAATAPMMKLNSDSEIECVVILAGELRELRKIVGVDKPFQWIEKNREYDKGEDNEIER